MKRTTNGFASMSDSKLMQSGQNIRQKMIGNDFFPTPIPTIAVLSDALDLYSASVATAEGGSREDIAQKNVHKQTIANMLTQLGFYVSMVSNGNEVMLISSGFKFTNSNEPQGPVTAVTNTEVLVDGLNPGQAKLKFKKGTSTKSYIYQYTADATLAEDKWTSITGTTTRYLFSELESGKRYWFRVASVGIDQQIMYSEVVTKVIQ